MFTGIITHQAKINKIIKTDSVYLEFETSPEFLIDLKKGDSIAINGACLTVVEISTKTFKIQIIPESLDKTAFKIAKENDLVNLEKALKLSQRLDGHLVQGHIDGVAKVLNFIQNEDSWVLEVEIPENFQKYIAYKGSICLNGVSLTVSKKTDIGLEVSLIKHTIENTNLKQLKVGALVNFEIDVIARYVENMIVK
jgi:riboflavin synthase